MNPVDDRTALALTIMGEARGEGKEGMEDVGHTIINRVAHPSWRGNTILDVCLKPYQYSCWNKGDPNRFFMLGINEDDPLYVKALSIADSLIAGALPDTTDGATYYYRIGSATPLWAAGKQACYISGNHEFFKDIA